MESKVKIEKNNAGIVDQLPYLRNEHFCDVRIQASESVITQQVQEKLQTLTRISFTKKTTKISAVQYCHRLVLAAAANDFLMTILNSHEYEDVLILMPDYSKSELNSFLSFIYGQSQDIDLSLPICQLFLKKDMKSIFVKNEFDDAKEELIEKEEVSDDEYVPDIPDIDYEITDCNDQEDVPLITRKRKAADKPAKKSVKKSKLDEEESKKVVKEVAKVTDDSIKKAKQKESDSKKKSRKNRVKEEQIKALAEAVGNHEDANWLINDANANPKELINEEPNWKCQFCDTLDNAKFSEYVKHFEETHQELLHKATCERCGNHYEAKEELLVHHLNIACVATKDPLVSCANCPCKFYSFRNLQSHVFLHHPQSCKPNLSINWCLYFCEICAKLYQSIESYRTHQSTKHELTKENFTENIEEELRFADKRNHDILEIEEKLTGVSIFCQICKARFDTRKDYKDHFKSKHPKEKWNDNIGFACGPNFQEIEKNVYCICYICQKSFAQRSSFRSHIIDMHEGDEKYPCKRCNTHFPTKLVLWQHRKTCMRTVPCEKCDFKAMSISRLRSHMTTDHPDNPDEGTKKRKIYEKVRMENGKVGYKCDLCDAILHSNKGVHHHRQVIHDLVNQDDLKTLHCPHEGCEYTTKFRMNLNNHTSRAHRIAKPICEHCGEKFVGAKELRHHVMRNHVHEEHACDECGKIFTNPLTLQSHKRTHGPPNYICQECGKGFRIPQQLRVHMKFTHSDFRGYVCLCSKAFKSKSHLIRHWKEKGHTKGQKLSLDGEVEDIEQRPAGKSNPFLTRVLVPKNVVETIIKEDCDSD